ncbi:MAG: sulfite exporter TauE/SafE family protein [Gammaproteobacteria bacterium]
MPLQWLFEDIGLTLAGLLVGFLVGITGMGGGSLMTPILLLGFGIAPLVAVSTDLLYAAITKLFGAIGYSRSGLVHWSTVGYLLLGSMPGTALAFWLLHQLDAQTAGDLTTRVLGIALLLTAVYILFKQTFGRLLNRHRPIANNPPGARNQHAVATVCCGLLLGVLVTLTSVGAGVLGTAFLLALYPTWPIQRVIATELVHAVVLTGVGGLSHLHLGTVDTVLLMHLLAGSIPGVLLGVKFARRVPSVILQPVIGLFLLAIGLRFVVG